MSFEAISPSEASALAASLDIETPPDLCEVFCVNRFDDPADATRAGLRAGREAFFAPNIWPQDLAGFKTAWTTYYAAMEGLADHLLVLMAACVTITGRLVRGVLRTAHNQPGCQLLPAAT